METFILETTFPVNFEILKKYHPLADVEYQLLKNNGQAFKKDLVLEFAYQAEDEASAHRHLIDIRQDIEGLYSRNRDKLELIDIGNIFYIIEKYLRYQHYKEIEQEQSYTNRFFETVFILRKIDYALKMPIDYYFQLLKRGENIANDGKQIVIRGENDLIDILSLLKSKNQDRILEMKESYLALTPNISRSLERYMDIACSLILNNRLSTRYEITYELIDRALRRYTFPKSISYKDEFLRMLYKSLSDYLTNETQVTPKKNKDGSSKIDSSAQLRTIHILCSVFGLIEKSDDKNKQYSSVRNVLKNFTSDHRFTFRKTPLISSD